MAAKVKTPAERAKEYRDRRREKGVAVPRENVAPALAAAAAKLERPAAVTEAPPEVAQLAAADLEAPPAAALAGDALPAAAVDALKASVAETPLGAPPPAAAAAAPPEPDAGALALGEQLGELCAWGCAQALERHRLPPLVAAILAGPMLPALAKASGAAAAAKYNLGGKLKLPCEVGVAVALGVTAWGAFGPPVKMGPAPKNAPAPADDEEPGPNMTPPVPLAAPWAAVTGPLLGGAA